MGNHSHNSHCSLSVSPFSPTDNWGCPESSDSLPEHVCIVAGPAGFLWSPINVTNPERGCGDREINAASLFTVRLRSTSVPQSLEIFMLASVCLLCACVASCRVQREFSRALSSDTAYWQTLFTLHSLLPAGDASFSSTQSLESLLFFFYLFVCLFEGEIQWKLLHHHNCFSYNFKQSITAVALCSHCNPTLHLSTVHNKLTRASKGPLIFNGVFEHVPMVVCWF